MGGGEAKRVLLEAKSETRRVADIIIRRNGCYNKSEREEVYWSG